MGRSKFNAFGFDRKSRIGDDKQRVARWTEQERLEALLSHVKVVSDAEAEEAEFVICCTTGTPSLFTDNVETVCAFCGTGIFHRPHVPKKPRKVCIECANTHIKEQAEAEEQNGRPEDDGELPELPWHED